MSVVLCALSQPELASGLWDTTPTLANTGENYHNNSKSVNPFEPISNKPDCGGFRQKIEPEETGAPLQTGFHNQARYG